MTAQSNLDLHGNFRTHPFSELLVEIAHARLSGSLRASKASSKAIFYFENGVMLLAVSNEKAFRLAETLASQNLVDSHFLKDNAHIVNDVQLADRLRESGRISAEETDRLIVAQSEAIIRSVLHWPVGEWTFSPLARLKSGLGFDINLNRILFDHARSLPIEKTLERFRSMSEVFVIREASSNGHQLKPHEAFILSRLDTELSLDDVVATSGLAQSEAMQSLYVLWLGGLVSRKNWNPAFSDIKISLIHTANVEVKKRAVRPMPKPKKVAVPIEVVKESDNEEPTAEVEFVLDDELNRIEAAVDYYDVLGVEPSAKVDAIRKSYFRMAKLLHPDRYHNEVPELLSRVERAFTELAQAHETLKNHDSRKTYDIRIKQEAEDRERARASGVSVEANKQEIQAAEDFERGLRLQLEGEFEAALPFLARAVYIAPKNARYHAYYGKALANDETQRHKAEGEIQTAIKLEPQTDSFRVMLAEFFIRFNLLKRAEGELTRLLKNSPDNKEARALLDTLRSK